MRLWHKDLITVLPRQQLLGQWRECCLIARSIKEQGTPNHILVNRIMNYPLDHFITYSKMIFDEARKRGYKVHDDRLKQWIRLDNYKSVAYDDLFYIWHDDNYLRQCFYNLQEKFDCGGIKADEYAKILTLKKLFENGIL